MDEPAKVTDKRRDHLANERTFLSWIRTSIGIMAFGFVVARFAFFANYIHMETATHYVPHRFSSFLGIVLVAFGSVLSILALFRFRAEARNIEMEVRGPASSGIIIVSTILVLAIGFLLIIYLADALR